MSANACGHDVRDSHEGHCPHCSYPYVWRVRSRLADRFMSRCRVIVRGAMNSCAVEFESDHYVVVTSRNYLRRAR